MIYNSSHLQLVKQGKAVIITYIYIGPHADFNPNKFKLPRRVKLKNKKAVHCGGRVGAHCPSGYKLIGTKHGTVKSRNNIKWKGKAPKCVRELP